MPSVRPAAIADLPPAAPPLVVSLRPVGDHAALRRAAAARGLPTLALSPWRIAATDTPASRAALDAALAAEIVIATSPAAARCAAALADGLREAPGQRWCAVGAGTAAALARAGIPTVDTPQRADSEGLLALPLLAEVAGRRIGLLSAPGGRDRIGPGLAARGAQVLRADVYARVPVAPAPRALDRLRGHAGPLLLPLSSGEALQRMLEVLPADLAARLRGACVLAASARLAALAQSLGCTDIRQAGGPGPRALLAVWPDRP